MATFKTTTQAFEAMDTKINSINTNLATVTELCKQTTVVIPTVPTDTQTTH